MEMMTLYFNRVKNPLLPLRFAALGWKLVRRGKVPLQLPSGGRGALASIFSKARRLEESS
jgi:heterodisulfide reductase subunit C